MIMRAATFACASSKSFLAFCSSLRLSSSYFSASIICFLILFMAISRLRADAARCLRSLASLALRADFDSFFLLLRDELFLLLYLRCFLDLLARAFALATFLAAALAALRAWSLEAFFC
jgi:hypothetical protein